MDVLGIIDPQFGRIVDDAVRITGAQFNTIRKHAIAADGDAFSGFGDRKMSRFYRRSVADLNRTIVVLKIKIAAIEPAIAANNEFVVVAAHENTHVIQQRPLPDFDGIVVALNVVHTIRQNAMVSNHIVVATNGISVFGFDVSDFGFDVQNLFVVLESLFQSSCVG